MRDIRNDLQDRASLLEEQINAAEAQFEKLAEQLRTEHEGELEDLEGRVRGCEPVARGRTAAAREHPGYFRAAVKAAAADTRAGVFAAAAHAGAPADARALAPAPAAGPAAPTAGAAIRAAAQPYAQRPEPHVQQAQPHTRHRRRRSSRLSPAAAHRFPGAPAERAAPCRGTICAGWRSMRAISTTPTAPSAAFMRRSSRSTRPASSADPERQFRARDGHGHDRLRRPM